MQNLNKVKDLYIAVLQLDFRVGDPWENVRKAYKEYTQAVARGATFVMGPELMTSGYPPKDNLLHDAFLLDNADAAAWLAAQVGDVPLAFGMPRRAQTPGHYGQKAYNSYVVAQNGNIIFATDKTYLAQGGVFDEYRVHKPGKAKLFAWKGLNIGFPICEDIWHEPVVRKLAKLGADVFLVPNGSPAYVGKPLKRQGIVAAHVAKTGKPMLYLNHVGGQDEHAFDGGAFYVNAGREAGTAKKPEVFGPYWQEAVPLVRLAQRGKVCSFSAETLYREPRANDYVLDAVVTTMKDYVLKSSSLRKLVIGISGGVDSAVVLGLAVLMYRAMGLDPAKHIIAVSLPSRHNGEATKGFAQAVCDTFGIPLKWWPIGDAVDSLLGNFQSVFGEPLKEAGNTAYENSQSRQRGLILMAIANRFGAMVLSTGNKSEMAMGYATLYGDMNGGFNPLKTLYKTQVYQLGYAINARMGFEAIPEALITQAPSAELDDGQLDENSLPPYPVLDAILMRIMDEKADPARILREPLDLPWMPEVHFEWTPMRRHAEAWQKVLATKKPMQQWMVYNRIYSLMALEGREYLISPACVLAVATQYFRMRFKRYQAPPGVTMTGSLDDGENYPIANAIKWLEYGMPRDVLPLAA